MLARITIKSLTVGSLALIGVASIVLTLIAASLFKAAATEEERHVLSRIIEVTAEQALNRLFAQSKEMGDSTQINADFRNAMEKIADPEQRNIAIDFLDDQFAQRYVTSGILQLHKLRVYDTELNFLFESSRGIDNLDKKMTSVLYDLAKTRTGADRLKALSVVWLSKDSPMYSVLVPIGSMRMFGYIEIVTDPMYNLRDIEKMLRAPTRIHDQSDKESYHSENWPEQFGKDDLLVEFHVPTTDGQKAVGVDIVENIKRFNDSFFHTQALIAGGFITIIVIGIIVSIAVLNTALFRPMKRLMENMGSVERGNLTVQVTPEGLCETQILGANLKSLVESLGAQVAQVHAHAGHLAGAAEELSIVTGETNMGMQSQQKETDQIATAINEMSATVHEVAKNAETAANAARGADQEVTVGKGIVTKTIDAIESLAKDIERSMEVIHRLEAESGNIGSVMDVIRGIAEQTNLLALNAAIEAARAGEQGRGFAVVADEVRVLASRTQQSTQEIEQMIERLQTGAGDAVKVMKENQTRAQNTVEHAANTGTTLETIAKSVGNIAEMNTQIASAAEEQSAVAEEINKSITNISKISISSAASSSQVAKSSESLAQLATDLQKVVSRFTIS